MAPTLTLTLNPNPKSRQVRPKPAPPHRLRCRDLPALAAAASAAALLLLFYSLATTTLLDRFPSQKHAFLYLSSDLRQVPQDGSISGGGGLLTRQCDVYAGRWVYDASYPLYNASLCPFAERSFRCQENGRLDAGYLKWRWAPYYCDIPRFVARDARGRLKGLRIAFVGDSLGRTQWESFVCLLMSDMSNKSSVYEVNGNNITKSRSYMAAHFKSDNIMVEYFRSPFLVSEGSPPKHVPKRVHTTLKLDKLEDSAARWCSADVLVFNTGHWWTGSKTFERGCYFQVGDSLRLGMNIETAFGMALSTWASWVKAKVDLKRTKVFFRSFEPAHWEGTWKNRLCPPETKPVLNSTFPEDFSHLQVLHQVVERVGIPVAILNITTLSSYRRDSHVGKWTGDPNGVDCCHWCLPGVPDIWNELLFTSLL